MAAGLEGKPFPDLALSDDKGQPFQLHSLQGKTLLLNFWATWCGPCVAELPALDRLHRALKDVPEIEILAVSVDQQGPPARIASVLRKKDYVLPLAFEPTGEATRRYGLTSIPMSFIIDKAGVVRHHIDGAREWDNAQWQRGLRQLHTG